MKKVFFPPLLLLFIFSCKENPQPKNTAQALNTAAAKYVRLALFIGQYDEAFVDAYYGPDSLKPVSKPAVFPKDSILKEIKQLRQDLKCFNSVSSDSSYFHRAAWLNDNLVAFDRRVRMYAGENGTFDEESKDLFGTAAPANEEAHFKQLVGELEKMLPGEGLVTDRFQALANRFVIPKEKLDTVFKAAIAECRKRTLAHFSLPANEDFKLEFVSNKSWNGYNWYKGNYQSLIQINTDLNIFIDRAIDVGSHESYPGHHVYNMLLEKNLYHDQGLLEISMYPLFSPQSLIAEGTANYGIDVVFPGDDKVVFAKEVLLPLAGLDTTGISLYFKAMSIKTKLNYARNEAARFLVSGKMNDEEATQWMMNYCLFNRETAAKSVSFIKANRSYVINYNYGVDLVKSYIERKLNGNTDPEMHWKVFGELLSNQVRIPDLK